ncbi:MAG: type II toxin-antitoxin system RelE/ParE family toxin [Gammaproteobacteria bacterium]|nr:type II toxin-antitoxin system RelE/ParE family toxin [Gammaproteobacteria bacterium]
MITIAETPPFIRKAQKLLSSSERNGLVSYLSIHPKEGVIIEGSGGIRKIRWARGSSGKSSGVRVIYYYHNDSMPLYLLALFAKNEKANISTKEKAILAKLTTQLTALWRH